MLYFVFILTQAELLVDYFLYDFILFKISDKVLVSHYISLLIAKVFESWVLDLSVEVQITRSTIKEWEEALELGTFLGFVK